MLQNWTWMGKQICISSVKYFRVFLSSLYPRLINPNLFIFVLDLPYQFLNEFWKISQVLTKSKPVGIKTGHMQYFEVLCCVTSQRNTLRWGASLALGALGKCSSGSELWGLVKIINRKENIKLFGTTKNWIK